MIETIEFVLGAVSNTASYLRLWALSLAHSQLGEVFLEQGLSKAWTGNPSLVMAILKSFVLWFPFWGVTMAVLMMMDVMECALHTVRLHWVEFQNKFFHGQGYLYVPFTFKSHKETAMSK
jgi:V-type H+-transporting ATPase subunit a